MDSLRGGFEAAHHLPVPWAIRYMSPGSFDNASIIALLSINDIPRGRLPWHGGQPWRATEESMMAGLRSALGGRWGHSVDVLDHRALHP